MKYLIIPDIHSRWEVAEKTIKHVEGVDKVVFLGDYFDDFHDDPHIAAETADWFHHSINQKNRIHLCGNHELHYWFADNKSVRCSGYEQSKSFAINDIVTAQDWKKLIFFYVLDDTWLLTHAGVHPCWINPAKFKEKLPVETTLKKLTNKLTRESEEFLRDTGREKLHWFDIPGRSRCRNSPYYGGLLWCDWTQEFWPTRGIHQLIGHTPLRGYETPWRFLKEGDPVTHTGALRVVPKPSNETSYNLCLDSHPGSQFYAVYENGNLTIHRNPFVTIHETRAWDDITQFDTTQS